MIAEDVHALQEVLRHSVVHAHSNGEHDDHSSYRRKARDGVYPRYVKVEISDEEIVLPSGLMGLSNRSSGVKHLSR